MEDASVSHKRNRTFKRAAKITPLTQRKHLQSEKKPDNCHKKNTIDKRKENKQWINQRKKETIKEQKSKTFEET